MVAVRRAGLGDAAALSRLLAQLHVDAPGDVPVERVSAVLPQIFADPTRHLLVADDGDGDGVLGTADVLIVANLTHQGRPYAAVENVVVDERSRGRGVGRDLMTAVIAIARERGCYKVQLQSNEARAPAHALYESLGFEPVARGYRRYF